MKIHEFECPKCGRLDYAVALDLSCPGRRAQVAGRPHSSEHDPVWERPTGRVFESWEEVPK